MDLDKKEIVDAIQSLNSLIDGDSNDELGSVLTPVVALLEKIVTPLINTKKLAIGISHDNGGFVGSVQIDSNVVAMTDIRGKLIDAGMADCDSILLVNNNEVVFHWDAKE